MSIQGYIEALTLADDRISESIQLKRACEREKKAAQREVVREMESCASMSDGIFGTTTLPKKPLLKAAVDVGSLLSFVDGVEAQDQEDVLFSVQLAQRGASGSYNRFSATESWYEKYIEILEHLGWTGEQLAFAKQTQSEGELRMDQAALAIITAIATQNQLLVLKESVGALAKLAASDGAITLFDFHSLEQASGNFQIGAVQKSENSVLAMALGAFYFQGTDSRRRFLFFSWGAQGIQFWTAAVKMTLNVAQYAESRDLVRQKLGLSAPQYIHQLVIS